MKKLVVVLCLITFTNAFSQQVELVTGAPKEEAKPVPGAPKKESTFQLSLEGQVVVATDGRGGFVNFGGPCLKFNFPEFSFSFGMMPSLRFENQENIPFITPILGAGPQVYFLKNKRFILSFPMYYLATKQQWTFTGGIGYILGKKK